MTQLCIKMIQDYYHYLNLPAPPFSYDDVITEEVLFRRKIPEGVGFGIPQGDGTFQNVTTYSRLYATPIANSWVSNTIPELTGHIREVGIQTHENSDRKNGRMAEFPIHTDGKRGRHVLCYLYETGGTNPETVWWQEENKPILRESGIYNEVNPAHFDRVVGTPGLHKLDHNSIKELARVSFKKHAWNLLRADVLHSLHNVENMRIGLTIGFSNDEVFNMLVDKYGIL